MYSNIFLLSFFSFLHQNYFYPKLKGVNYYFSLENTKKSRKTWETRRKKGDNLLFLIRNLSFWMNLWSRFNWKVNNIFVDLMNQIASFIVILNIFILLLILASHLCFDWKKKKKRNQMNSQDSNNETIP